MSNQTHSGTKTVYLTFDDGPDPRWTPRILDILAASGAKATFFAVGQQARRHGVLLRRIAIEGHGVGNHTWSHRHPRFLGSDASRREVRDGRSAIEDTLGERPMLFRPPHGYLNPSMAEEARRSGHTIVLWTLSAVDWGPLGRSRGIARRLARMQAGDIVLMHDHGWGINRPRQLVSVLPHQLRILTMQGLRSVRLH
ncbi:MAG: polysaccharide deacetylase family protein [Aquisalimonadaceae bacterium]